MPPRRTGPSTAEVADRARHAFAALELDRLPAELRRNSLDHYYLSVWPGLRHLAPIGARDAPPRPGPVRSAYLHFPFCTGLCDFCSYFVMVARDPVHDARIARHVDDVLLEVDLNQRGAELDVSYLYLGGGTPSLMAPDQLDRLLGGLRRRGALAARLQGTVELHPELFADRARADEFLGVLRDHGIGRVSLGYQAADDALLEAANRRHDADAAAAAATRIREAGLRFNLDLMYGLPDQSLELWIATLEAALALGADSYSTYFTFVDPGTKLRRDVDAGRVALPGHDLIQTQHVAAQIVLGQAGLHELPNDFWSCPEGDPAGFVQTSLPSDANSLGLGPGAYGYFGGLQYFNEFNLGSYRKALGEGRVPLWRGARLDAEQRLRRDVMFSLKNEPALDVALFESRYGAGALERFAGVFARLEALGLARSEGRVVRLTAKGRLVVEEIACLFEPPGHHAAPAPSGRDAARVRRHNFAPTYSRLAA